MTLILLHLPERWVKGASGRKNWGNARRQRYDIQSKGE